jgi:hypothetical protein
VSPIDRIRSRSGFNVQDVLRERAEAASAVARRRFWDEEVVNWCQEYESLAQYAELYRNSILSGKDAPDPHLAGTLADVLRKWQEYAAALLAEVELVERSGRGVEATDRLRQYVGDARFTLEKELDSFSGADLANVQAEAIRQWAATEGAYERGECADAEDIIRELQAGGPAGDPATSR